MIDFGISSFFVVYNSLQEIRIKTSDPVLFIAEVQEERHIIPVE